MATVFTLRKSGDQADISPLSRQISEWEKLAAEQRDRVLGQNYLHDIEQFFTLSDSSDANTSPTFRPSIKIPELQTLMLYEANDLSESSPRVYITNQNTGAQEEDREKSFQAEWRRSRVNYHAMFAMLWSLFGGLGVLQLGLNPDARGGRGSLWAKARNPISYFPDPTTAPDLEWKYPNGRLIVECNGRILSDGDNPWPLGMFPTVPFWSMPPLFGIWGVPAVRYSITLQNVAERLMTGVFENAVRLNNGVWFIHSNTGIDAEAFGGSPGEVCVINPQSTVPQCVFPQQMPAHFTQIPTALLDRQKALQGFTPARSGSPGAGNLSPELYDESVLRSQGLTQLRGRLGAVSFQMFSELWFYTMCRFFTQSRTNLVPTDEGRKPVEWKPLDHLMQGRPDAFDVEVDEASIQPLSQTVLRKMVPELMKSKVLSVRRGLNMLNFPHAEEVAREHEQEMSLEALSRAKGVRR